MIYQACGLDKTKREHRSAPFLFGGDSWDRSCRRATKADCPSFFLAFGNLLDIAVSLFGIYNLLLVLPILSYQNEKRSAEALPFCLVGTVGIEPMTSCMSSMRSNQLSYAPMATAIAATLILYHIALGKSRGFSKKNEIFEIYNFETFYFAKIVAYFYGLCYNKVKWGRMVILLILRIFI